jgi:aspartyl protease family protein
MTLRMTLRCVALLALLTPAVADAVDVTVIGLFPGKAVVTVNRGAPRTVAVGQTAADGVKLLSTDASGAVFEIEGKRERLEMGQHFESPGQAGARQAVTLPPDSRGHFMADGQVNGGHVRFLVDTGATMVSLPSTTASRLGIDWKRGQRGLSQTANGASVVYKVTLDSVTLGDITVLNVDALVHDAAGLDTALLGMSFLSRMEMRREGPNLTLVKRY